MGQGMSRQETSLRRNPELELVIHQSPAINNLPESNYFLPRVLGRYFWQVTANSLLPIVKSYPKKRAYACLNSCMCERQGYGKCFLLQIASFSIMDKSATFVARVLPLRSRALLDESDPEEQL